MPLNSVVLAVGLSEVTAEVATGFVVLQVTETEQALEPAAMVQLDADEDSEPDMTAAWQELPFHVVPVAQVAVTGWLASNWALL